MNPLIYNFVDEKDLSEIVNAFQVVTGLSTFLLDENGQELIICGKKEEYCKCFAQFLPKDETCKKEHQSAGRRSIPLGEAYIFCCHAGLYHITFPITRNNLLLGNVIAGPFLMEEPDSALVLDLTKKYDIPVKSLLELSLHANHLPILPPEKVTHMGRLLYYLIYNIIFEGGKEAIENKQKAIQQAKIADAIASFKQNKPFEEASHYPYDKEKLLIAKVKTGDIESAKKIINEIFAYIFFTEADYNLEKAKARLVEICSLLSRASIDAGANLDNMLNMNAWLISIINDSTDIFDLSYRFQENIDIFTESLFYRSETTSEAVKSAANYVLNNYSEKITLEDVAEHVHLSPSYFSQLFKQVAGESFKEYLTNVRIEEARRLLANTDYSILDIAVACGFEDQSYFTKVFKKKTGATPKQFR